MRCAIRGTALWDYPQEYLVVIRDEKVSPFVKFEKFLPLLCFLLDSLTNKHCWAWSFIINLWIDFRTYKKKGILLSARQRSSNNLKPSKAKVLDEDDALTLIMIFLKVLCDMVSKILKLIYLSIMY